jgi:hypothetical protein
VSARIAVVVTLLVALLVPTVGMAAPTAKPSAKPSGVVVAWRVEAHAVVVAGPTGRLRQVPVRGDLPGIGTRVTGRATRVRTGRPATEARVTGTVTAVGPQAHTVRSGRVTVVVSGPHGHQVGDRVTERVGFLRDGGLVQIGSARPGRRPAKAPRAPGANRGRKAVLRGVVLDVGTGRLTLRLGDATQITFGAAGVDLADVLVGDAVTVHARRSRSADGTVAWTLLALQVEAEDGVADETDEATDDADAPADEAEIDAA